MRNLILPLLLSSTSMVWAGSAVYPELNTNYQPPVGWNSQCLGRMQFNVPENVTWPLAGTALKQSASGRGDVWLSSYGTDPLHSDKYLVSIRISVPITLNEWKNENKFIRPNKGDAQKRVIQKKIDEINQALKAITGDDESDRAYEELIDQKWSLGEQLKRVGKMSTDILVVTDMIDAFKKQGRPIDHLEAELKELLAEDAQYPTDEQFKHEYMLETGVPNSLVLSVPDSIFATVWSHGREYTFQFGQQHGKPASTQETLEPAAIDLLSRFRARGEHEIPSEPGVCLPFGFIADNGREPFQFGYSWSPSAHKNDVIYRFDQPASNEVATSFLKRLVAGNLFPSRLSTQHFGPMDVPFAGREGSLIGARYQARDPSNPEWQPPETYRMVADVSATEHLPSLSLKLDSQQAEGIPSFEQADAEFKEILKSFRPLPGIAAQIKAASRP